MNLINDYHDRRLSNLIDRFKGVEEYLESAKINDLTKTTNTMHRDICHQLRATAMDIWFVGRILKREKELVGHGSWMEHCKKYHPEISNRTIERYLRVGEIETSDLDSILDKTPQQAYLMLRILKEGKKLPSPATRSTVMSNLRITGKVEDPLKIFRVVESSGEGSVDDSPIVRLEVPTVRKTLELSPAIFVYYADAQREGYRGSIEQFILECAELVFRQMGKRLGIVKMMD
jgi:hypothetical protein